MIEVTLRRLRTRRAKPWYDLICMRAPGCVQGYVLPDRCIEAATFACHMKLHMSRLAEENSQNTAGKPSKGGT